MSQDDDSFDLPFGLLADYADASPVETPRVSAGSRQSIPLVDRFAASFAGGWIPLTVLLALAIILATRQQPPQVGACAALLLPLLLWFFLPLARAGKSALAWLPLPILGAASLAGLVPIALEATVKGHPVEADLLTGALQKEMQGISPGALCLYAGVSLGLILLTPHVLASFPWLDVPHTLTRAVLWRLAALLVAGVGVLWALHGMLGTDKAEAVWKEEAARRYAELSRPKLPNPAARETRACSCDDLLSAISDEETQALLCLRHAKLALLAPPDARVSAGEMINDLLTPYLASAEFDDYGLSLWSQRLDRLQTLLIDTETALDLTAYGALSARPTSLAQFWAQRRLTRRWLQEREVGFREKTALGLSAHFLDLSLESHGREREFWAALSRAAGRYRDRLALEAAQKVISQRQARSASRVGV